MQTNSDQTQTKAHNLYFNTDLAQKQIAGMLNISRKTLYLWIKEGGWKRAKYTARHAPCLLVEQYYTQLGNINLMISKREERPYPTKEEADIIRKLGATIKQMEAGRRTSTESILVFQEFMDKLKRKNLDMAQKLIPLMDEHIKELTEDGKWLKYAKLHREDKMFDEEFGEWLDIIAEENTPPLPPDYEPWTTSPGSETGTVAPEAAECSQPAAASANTSPETPPTPEQEIIAPDHEKISEAPAASNDDASIPPEDNETPPDIRAIPQPPQNTPHKDKLIRRRMNR